MRAIGGPILGYDIFSSGGGSMTVGPDVTSGTVTGLTDGTPYAFEVSAFTADGPGPPESGASWETPAPPNEDPNLTGAKLSNEQVTVTWVPPASKKGGTIVGYQISDSQGHVVDVGSAAKSAKVPVASAGSDVLVVSAVRQQGQQKGVGPPSQPLTVLIPATAPGTPLHVAATAANHSATVSWQPPASDGGDAIDGYAVKVYGCAPKATPCSQKVLRTTKEAAGTTSVAIRSLVDGKQYWFTVAATNEVGTGPASAKVTAAS